VIKDSDPLIAVIKDSDPLIDPLIVTLPPVIKDSDPLIGPLDRTPADRSQQMAGAYLDPAMPLASQFLDSLAAFVGSAAPVRR